MLAFQFISQNFHFALSLFAGLVFFAVFWLYFDAWLIRKRRAEVVKWTGFLILSLSFLLHSTSVEQTLFGGTFFGGRLDGAAALLRVFGYVLVIIGLVRDPLQPIPETTGLDEAEPIKKAQPAVIGGVITVSFTNIVKLLLPLGSFAIAVLYWRRATTGLERHLKAPGLAFGLIGLHELLGLGEMWQATTNPRLYELVAPFGPLWYVEHLLLLAGSLVLGKWVWQYLTTRVFSQLFMTFIASTITVFLLSTVGFSFLLMRNVQNDALSSLETAANVLNYALDSKKAESLSLAESIASSSDVINGVATRNHSVLNANTAKLLEIKKQSTILITDDAGQVLSRAEDAERRGDSLSEDPAIKQALAGAANSNFITREDVIAPQVLVLTASPIKDSSGQIIGVVRVGLLTDNSFLDGVKNTTGLDSAIYAGEIRSATTFISPDGKTRLVGIKETNKQVSEQVLGKGQIYAAATTVLNRPTLGVYYPLKDARNAVIGMLFVGKPQSILLKTAGRSIELTFLLAAALMISSIGPNYLLARRISREVR